jgi:HK97 family phage major capsid protein
MPKLKNGEKVVSVRELADKYQANCARINEIADTCEKEGRERSEAETEEYKTLSRENEFICMKMQAYGASQFKDNAAVDTDAVLRENLLGENSRKVTVALMREVTPQTTAALADTGIIPVAQQELIEPIRKGLIWDKVGLPIRTGLAGTLRWPVRGKAYAQFADETERLVDSAIDFSKLEMSGARLGIAIPVSREELEDSEGIVESVVKSEAPAAIIDVINDTLFDPTGKYAINKSGDTRERKVKGPFVDLTPTTFKATLPTRAELLSMVAAVASKVDLKNPCWVMTDAMKFALCDVKVDAGSGRFVCENDMILGFPVFTTAAIGESYIGFGDWSYQAAGFFGQLNFIVDPYTLARQNSVDFVLNARFGTATLRKEAFALGKTSAE